MDRTCTTYEGEARCIYRVLVGKPERRPLGRHRHRWENNNKIDLRKVGWDSTDWIDLAQDKDRWRALANTVINLRVLQNSIKFLSDVRRVSFSGRSLLHGVSLVRYISEDGI
jgi:hypothetical protein